MFAIYKITEERFFVHRAITRRLLSNMGLYVLFPQYSFLLVVQVEYFFEFELYFIRSHSILFIFYWVKHNIFLK